MGLLNILEERDVQVRGYTLRLPLDLFVVASANPEDYTSRGRIITPLKDRLGSQIRTHYPRTIEDEIAIMLQERTPLVGRRDPGLIEPRFMLELVAELSHLARRSPEVSQRSGVSVRVSIANLETCLGERRQACRAPGRGRRPRRASAIWPRWSPRPPARSSSRRCSDEMPEERVVDRLLARAIHNVFERWLDVDDLDEVVEAFEAGLVIETGEMVPSGDYVRWMRETPGLDEAVARLGGSKARRP